MAVYFSVIPAPASPADGGRVCWIIADTMCHGEVQTTFQYKLEECSKCDFYIAVREEEGGKPEIPLDILEKLCVAAEKPTGGD